VPCQQASVNLVQNYASGFSAEVALDLPQVSWCDWSYIKIRWRQSINVSLVLASKLSISVSSIGSINTHCWFTWYLPLMVFFFHAKRPLHFLKSISKYFAEWAPSDHSVGEEMNLQIANYIHAEKSSKFDCGQAGNVRCIPHYGCVILCAPVLGFQF
jgi:hypothetical protein